MDLFLIKKIIGILIMPLSVILLLLFFAIVFYKLKPKFSFSCLFLATALLFLSTFRPASDALMAPIEAFYPAFTKSVKAIDYIVILGCGHKTDYALPKTSQLKTCSLQRLVEAIRVFKLHPEARLITSGYAGYDEVTNAEKVKQAAMVLGISENKIIVEPFPQDTEEEALLLAPRLRGKNVVLVTNADHMPRAISYFKQYGVEVIAAPASKYTKGLNNEKYWVDYMPKATNLQQTTRAWYERIGQFVQWMKED